MRNVAAFGRFVEEIEQRLGDQLQTHQLRTLVHLYTYGETSQTALMKAIGVPKTTHSRNIARLDGFVENYTDDEDRRTKMVRLTRKGRSVLGQAAQAAFGGS